MRTENHNCAAKLPVELDYLIIDHLADDKTSLKSCSLVCHAWTAVAHSHLFRSVNVHSTASEARFSAFITSLKMYPDIRAHIQDLTLGCDLAGSFDNKRAEIVNVLTIHSVVSLLPKLRYLTLAGVSLQPQPLNSPSFPLASLPHLCSLHIKGCYFHDEDMTLALDVVRMFAAVGELSFGGFWSMEHARSSSVTQSSQTAIQHLHYDNLGAGPTKMLFESLQTSRVRGAALESLHLTWSSWAEVHEYQAVMGDATSSLKRLELEPTDQFWERGAPKDVTRWHKLDLNRHTRLEYLCLHLRYSHLSYRTDGHQLFFAALAAYTHILAQYPPPSLRHLTLRIPLYLREGGVDVTGHGTPWSHIDAAISQMPVLASVTLVICPLGLLTKASEGTLSHGFQRVLARTYARGILSVQYQGVLQVDPFDCAPIPLPPGRVQTPSYTDRGG